MLNENETGKPVLQVLGIKCIKPVDGYDRYRLLVSDGKNLHSFAMLASQMNDLIKSERLDNFCIIKVHQHTVSLINAGDAFNK